MSVAPLADLLGRLPAPLSPASVFLYGIGGAVLLNGLARFQQWRRSRRAPAVDLADVLDEATVDPGRDEAAAFDDLAERQQAAIAPAAVAWETRVAKVGDELTTTLTFARIRTTRQTAI